MQRPICYLGQKITDYKGRQFIVVCFFHAVGKWDDSRSSVNIQFTNGFETCIQGKYDDGDVVKFGIRQLGDQEGEMIEIGADEMKNYIQKRQILLN